MKLISWTCCALACVSALGCRCSDPRPAPDVSLPEAGLEASSSVVEAASPEWIEVHDLDQVLGSWSEVSVTSRKAVGDGMWKLPYHYRLVVKDRYDCGLFRSKADVGYCLDGSHRVVKKIKVWTSGQRIRIRIGDDVEVVGART